MMLSMDGQRLFGNKRGILLVAKKSKIIKIKVNDREVAKLVRRTLMNKGFWEIFCKDFGNKVELGFIRINQ